MENTNMLVLMIVTLIVVIYFINAFINGEKGVDEYVNGIRVKHNDVNITFSSMINYEYIIKSLGSNEYVLAVRDGGELSVYSVENVGVGDYRTHVIATKIFLHTETLVAIDVDDSQNFSIIFRENVGREYMRAIFSWDRYEFKLLKLVDITDKELIDFCKNFIQRVNKNDSDNI